MGLKARLEALNRDASIVRFLNFIPRVCPIPPSLRIQAMPMTRLLASATAVTLLLAAGMIATMPPLLMGPFVEVIDKDFVLTHRGPRWAERGPHQMGFWLEENDTLVIRNCTIYTMRFYAPPELGVYKYGEDTSVIYMQGFANLTMINVKVVPYVDIWLSGHASVKMINVTNWSPAWFHEGEGLYWLVYEGSVHLQGNSRAWIEDSHIAGAAKDPFSPHAEVLVKDTWFAGSSRYGDAFAQGNKAVRLSGSVSKTVFQQGEPISMTFRLENVGNETLTFLSNGTDRFVMQAYLGEAVEGVPIYHSQGGYREPNPPEYHFPASLKPGEALVQTQTWRGPPLGAGRYVFAGDIWSPSNDILLMCVPYWNVTITEEKWQG